MYDSDDDWLDDLEDDDFDWETLPYQDKWISEGVPTQAYKEHLRRILRC